MTHVLLLVVILLGPVALAAQPVHADATPHAFPRPGATRVLENAWVTAWDATWVPNASTGMHRHSFDYFGVELADSRTELLEADGKSRMLVLKRGFAWYLAKGATHAEIGRSDNPPRRALLVDRSEVAAPVSENGTSFPTWNPDSGAQKLTDNTRIGMWDCTWTPGAETPLEFYGRHVVVMIVDGGELSTRGPDGAARVSSYDGGAVIFLPGGQVRAMQATSGTVRGIVVEIK